MPKLLQASVFYRNDTATGFGFTVDPDTWDIIEEHAQCMWRDGLREYGTADALAAEFIQQLAAMGKLKHRLSEEHRMLVMLNIVALALNGYVQNTEFDGLLLVYDETLN